MHMSMVVGLGASLLAAVAVASEPPVPTRAGPPRPTADGETSPPPAPPPPKPLSGAKLTTALGVASQRIHTPVLRHPQALEVRLTPVASRLDNTTLITYVEGTNYHAPSEEVPSGTYTLLADGYPLESEVWMRLKTEKDKFYIGDCRLWEKDVYPPYEVRNEVKITAPGLKETFTIVDGHVLFAFRAAATSSEVKLLYRDKEQDAYRYMHFYGCDFGEAG